MKKIKLTQGQVALVDDADFDWLNQWNWCAHYAPHTNSFYAVRESRKKEGKIRAIWMSREILKLKQGDKGQADHINHDTLDNRRCNLRVCTSRQNNMNRKADRNSSSCFKGVSWRKYHKKWGVEIALKGKNKHIGYFSVEEDAARAYDEAAKIHFGEFAHLNFGG